MCTWKPNAYNICIKYDHSFSAREALANAEKEIEKLDMWSDSETVDAKWSDSDMFVHEDEDRKEALIQ